MVINICIACSAVNKLLESGQFAVSGLDPGECPSGAFPSGSSSAMSIHNPNLVYSCR